MAVNVRVEIEFRGRQAEAVALANSGYEAPGPELLAPRSFLRSHLRTTSRGRREKYVAAGGSEVEFQVLGSCSVRVKAEGKVSSLVRAALIASEKEDRIVMNDALVGELGLDLVDVWRGRWRFSDDPPGLLRPGETKETY